MPDLKKFSHLKVAPAIFFPYNHFNVRNVGNFIVLYWPAALNVKLLQMIETQAVVFLMYFKESFTVMFVACWVIFKVYRLLSLERFWWSSHWYKFLIRCGNVCAALTESKTVFFSPFFFFLSVCSQGAVCTWTVKATVAMWKTPNIQQFPCLFTVWNPCRKWGCGGINDATRMTLFL